MVSRRHPQSQRPSESDDGVRFACDSCQHAQWLIGGKLADRISKRKLFIIATIVARVGDLLFVAAKNFAMTKLPAILFGAVRVFFPLPTGLWLST